MLSEWDEQYAARTDFFGEPYPELVELLAARPRRGALLDVGCGQGRDALAAARLGFHVVAVDPSSVAIGQLERVARAEGLEIEAHLASAAAFEPRGPYSLVLIDMVLHALGSEVDKEDLVDRLLDALESGGALAVVTPGRDADAELVRRARQATLVADRPILHRYEGEDLTFHFTVVERI